MLTLTKSDIPTLLQEIPDPPTCLYVRGDTLEDILQKPRIAIVGSRKVTPYGKHITQLFASELAKRGVVIVSGLALGVDSIAHAAALDAGGVTMAVLPGSVTNIYPRTHQQLADRMVAQGGVLLSEYQTGAPTFPFNFVHRNRLVSGISSALLVTEAAAHSGTMHTAQFAQEQGRQVFAMPGPITNPQSAGTNALIQRGAQLVTDADQILAALGITKQSRATLLMRDSPDEQVLIDLLQSGISDGGELLAQSGFSAAKFAQVMTMLEIEGVIKPIGNNHWAA